MRISSILYGLWCLMVVMVFVFAQRVGYSPFASGGRPMMGAYGYGGGPHHK
jgi:hypothetical protein